MTDDATADRGHPACSVVIPTYNRRRRLQRVLHAVATQVVDTTFEIVVVSDGSTDETEDYLATLVLPVPLRWASQPNSGPAAARNRGVDMAEGDLIIFVDDDVVPTAGMLQAHIDAHRRVGDNAVVIGPMLDPPDFDLSPWTSWEQAMLRKQYRAMDRGDYPATSRQFYTGNASLARRHLHDVGGFNPEFRRAEDVELAYRLDDHGLGFFYENQAVGHHYAERSFDSWKSTAYVYGRNDVVFGRDPNRSWMLSFMAYKFNDQHPLARWATILCIRTPALRSPLTGLLRYVAVGAERLRLGPLSRYALSGIFSIEFHSGIADELGGSEQFIELLREQPTTTDPDGAEQ